MVVLLRLVVAVGAAVLVGAAGASAARASENRLPSTALRDYAVLGLDGVTLRRKVLVESGDVASNASSGSVTLMARARVAEAVAGKTVRVGQNASAAQFFCRKLEKIRPNSATCMPLGGPLFNAADLPPVQVTPGSVKVRLAPKTTGALGPGRYGAVRVGNAAQLTLAGGDYEFGTLWVGRRSELVCEAQCAVRVAKRVVLKESALLTGTASAGPAALRLEVGGRLGRRAVVRVFRRAIVDASVYAPNGSVVLGMNGRYTGPIIGRKVLVHQRSRILGPGAEPREPRVMP